MASQAAMSSALSPWAVRLSMEVVATVSSVSYTVRSPASSAA